jgi:hypothetical protein
MFIYRATMKAPSRILPAIFLFVKLSLVREYNGYDLVVGGDFIVDLVCTSANTKRLYDFCVSNNMICADFHYNTDIDLHVQF